MRVAFLLPAPGIPVQGPSGSSAHVRGLVSALREQHEVRLYAARLADHRGAFGEDIEAIETGVPSWPGVLRGWRELREVLAARRLARKVEEQALAGWRPDLVIERHSLFSDAGWRLSDRLGIPHVLEVNAPPVLERGRFEEIVQPALAARWERQVLLAAPVVVAVSRWLVRWLRDEIGCPDVRWVPNGAAPLQGDRPRGRALLGLSSDEPVVGFVGSMKPWHGVDRLGEIARGIGARLAIIGNAAPAQLPEDAIRTGHLNPQQLADAIAALDIGLAPYPAQAPPWFCPLKILDYRAQGTPVVATDTGDVAALVEDGGSIVPPDDTAALIEAARSWLGRRVVPRVRSWRIVAQEILAAAAR